MYMPMNLHACRHAYAYVVVFCLLDQTTVPHASQQPHALPQKSLVIRRASAQLAANAHAKQAPVCASALRWHLLRLSGGSPGSPGFSPIPSASPATGALSSQVLQLFAAIQARLQDFSVTDARARLRQLAAKVFFFQCGPALLVPQHIPSSHALNSHPPRVTREQ